MFPKSEITKVKEIVQRVSSIESEIDEEKNAEKIRILKRKLRLFRTVLLRYVASLN